MNRRDFLKVGTVGASGALVLGGTADGAVSKLEASRPRPIPLPDMDEYVTQVDAGVRAISRWSPSAMAPDWGGDRAAVDDLARKSLGTLYMTAMFSDLPEAGRQHPGMQQRIFDAMPAMDGATAGMSAYLKSRTPEQLQELQRAVRHPDNPAMEVFDALDRRARTFGVSSQRRMQTRVMMTQANWRLRNQPPSLVIADTLDKVDKLVATDVAAEARNDWMAGRVAEELFWQQQGQSDPQGGWSVMRPDRRGRAMSPADSLKSPRERRISSGARIMGIGLIVFGVSAGLTAAGAFPFVFVATAGAIMILVGLLTLLVGLATPARKPGSG